MVLETLKISLHVFSGVEDPQWEVSSSNPDHRSIIDLLQNHVSTEHPSVLGYHGFTVEQICDGQVVQEFKIGKKTSVELERKLLETAPEEVVQRVGEYVYRALADS